MKIETSSGTIIFDENAIPSEDDMNTIISSVTADDDDGAQFQRLCDASTAWPEMTCGEFMAACEKWISEQ